MIIRTVTGDIAPDGLDVVLFHEHLANSMAPWIDDPDLHFVDEAAVSSDLELAAGAGVSLIVDATTPDFGRNPTALRRMSEASGVKIVAGCGLYTELTYPEWIEQVSSDELADRLDHEIKDGVDATGIRAGVFGEIGISSLAITNHERKVIEAVAIAHHRTGASIITHTAEGRHAVEMLDLFTALGVQGERIAIGHVDCMPDTGMHLELAARGAYIGFDRVGQIKYGTDAMRADHLVRLLDAGFERQVLLSSDIGRLSRLRTYGGRGYTQILSDFWPILSSRGVPRDVFDRIMKDNPVRLLSFES